MPELSRLTRPKPTVVTLDLGEGDTVNLTFDANAVTPRWMNDTMLGAADTDLLVLAKALEQALISWDVTDDGAPYPPTANNISALSFPVVNQLFEEVCKAAAPSDSEGNASSPSVSDQSSGSDPALPTFQNGSGSSTSQPNLESQPSR